MARTKQTARAANNPAAKKNPSPSSSSSSSSSSNENPQPQHRLPSILRSARTGVDGNRSRNPKQRRQIAALKRLREKQAQNPNLTDRDLDAEELAAYNRRRARARGNTSQYRTESGPNCEGSRRHKASVVGYCRMPSNTKPLRYGGKRDPNQKKWHHQRKENGRLRDNETPRNLVTQETNDEENVLRERRSRINDQPNTVDRPQRQ